MDNHPKYDHIKKRVSETNTAVVTSISISGEDVSGIFNAFAVLTFLRWHIINDTYHPYLFHYYVGVSVGSIIVGVVLNARFLYEDCGKEKSLEYLDAVLSLFSFEAMRSLFLDMGDGNVFSLFNFNVLTLISNLYNYGSICSRDVVKRFLNAEAIPNFDNTENYFTSAAYYRWLDNELDNVFIVAYSAQQTKMVTFTGNKERFTQPISFVSYKKLTPLNLIHAIICSSSIPLLHPIINIDGTNYATSGSSAERNQICFLQTMINCSYFFSSNLIYTPLLIFFGIDDKLRNGDERKEFTIIYNKLNAQEWLEIPDKYPHRQSKFLQSLQSLLNYFPRIIYNATNNIPLLSLFRQQPYVQPFSNININKIKQAEFDLLKNIILLQEKVVQTIDFKDRIPSFDVDKKTFRDTSIRREFKNYKEYKKAYSKYKVLTSNQPITSFLYDSNPPEEIELLDENFEVQYEQFEKGKYIECHGKYILTESDERCIYVKVENNKYVTTVDGGKLNLAIVNVCSEDRYSRIDGVFTLDNQQGTYIKVPSEKTRYKRRTLSLNICYFDMNIRDIFESDNYQLFGLFTNDIIGNAKQQISFMKNMGIVSGNLLFDMTTKQQTYSFKQNAPHSNAPNELNDLVEDAYDGFLGTVQS